MTTTILGLPPFKLALYIEILANLSSLPALILSPSYGASFLLSTTATIAPSTLTLTRWFGGLVGALTVPLVFSLPSPSGSDGTKMSETDRQRQIGFRRATYITMGAGEVFLSRLMVWAYIQGEEESGFSGNAMLAGAANMGALLALRVLFLVGRPELIEECDGKVKGQ
ncbi:hypothetical protein AC579_2037 [Pseudocercospora musae]|uniref:Uncharacterized protein n=1 Tax=Pseudocercospora musae TaxID=113226 RepID=A0A139IRA7_9PEZI|nr:hypothetical protein AC579_2037 [Pseudocercospora musae]